MRNLPTHKLTTLLVIIIAGEIIFSLPFHIPRFFRPTFMEVFQISNTELGDMFAVYGMVAMLSYFPGGILADHFAPRKLMTFSLIATAIGGFYFAVIPSPTSLYLLFGYWGCTSILLFWGAMIKHTRIIGGSSSQGVAFGLLDGGRGLVASLLASLALFLLISYSAQSNGFITDKKAALQSVIIFYSILTFVAALIVFFFLEDIYQENNKKSDKHSLLSIKQVMIDHRVWLQGGIIICAYCGYKSLDNYGIYATQVLNMNHVDAASLTTIASYMRPLAAFAAGFIADRWQTAKTVKMFFILATLSFALTALLQYDLVKTQLIIANLFLTFIAVYALRGIYFALIEESQIAIKHTGTAVGVISLIGFTPDIFFASLTGRILDSNPGFIGFQHYFMLISACSGLGILLVHLLTKHAKPQPVNDSSIEKHVLTDQ